MKFMSPIVTESPMLMRKSRLPYASPSKSTPRKLLIIWLACPGFAREHPGPGTVASLPRVFLIGKLVEFDVVETAAGFLDLADIHRLHHVACFRIDHDRSARAIELHSLHCRDELVAIGRAAGLLQRLIDGGHAVVSCGGHEIRTQL